MDRSEHFFNPFFKRKPYCNALICYDLLTIKNEEFVWIVCIDRRYIKKEVRISGLFEEMLPTWPKGRRWCMLPLMC